MKNLILSLIIGFSLPTLALETGVVSMPGNRVVSYETNTYQDSPVAATFVFLPGIYRGHHSEDELVKVLKKEKINYVIFDFAEQPASILKTPVKTAPDFSHITSKDLAQEVEILVDYLKIKNAIPVTLSYSATVTKHLNVQKFPLVVEAAPISKDTDTLPPAIVALYNTWKAWLKLNPFGEIWLRATKETNLRWHWGTYVAGLTYSTPELRNPVYSERAIEGYKALTFASEDFDLRDQDFANGPQRIFVLAENEDWLRLQVQKEAISIYQEMTGHRKSAVTLPKAGHILTKDQPEAFVQFLKTIQLK